MASIYDLKPKFQNLLRPLMSRLVALGVTANGVTIAAVVGSILVGVAVGGSGTHRWMLLLVPVWLFLRMALNAIDGMMAREFDQKSNLGAFLNELGDVISDAALYVPIGLAFEPLRWPAVVFTIGAILTEFCGVLCQALGGSRRYEGPMGKSDRAFAFGVMALVIMLSESSVPVVAWVLWAAVVLELVTCANRVRTGLREIGRGGVLGGAS